MGAGGGQGGASADRLVGPTAADARHVMVEGASGILAISPIRSARFTSPAPLCFIRRFGARAIWRHTATRTCTGR
jgi:phage terminase large subunit-like protein